jgi:hypothetical protein
MSAWIKEEPPPPPPPPVYRYRGRELTSNEVKKVSEKELAKYIASGEVTVSGLPFISSKKESNSPRYNTPRYNTLTSTEIEANEALIEKQKTMIKDQGAKIKALEAKIQDLESEIYYFRRSQATASGKSHSRSLSAPRARYLSAPRHPRSVDLNGGRRKTKRRKNKHPKN